MTWLLDKSFHIIKDTKLVIKIFLTLINPKAILCYLGYLSTYKKMDFHGGIPIKLILNRIILVDLSSFNNLPVIAVMVMTQFTIFPVMCFCAFVDGKATVQLFSAL